MDKDTINSKDLLDEKTKINLSINTLNPEEDLLYFIKEMNFKLNSNEVKYPEVIIFIIFL
jgi:hypothetical protein